MSKDQDALPAEGMPDAPGLPTHITFVGMGTDTYAGELKYRGEYEFKVRVSVVLGPTLELMAAGERQVVKVKVEEIEPLSWNEPKPVQDISPDGDRDDIGND